MNMLITLVVEIISFALFIYFFKKVLWSPLMGVMEKRTETIAEGIAAGERGEKQLEEAREESEKMLRETRQQVQEILSNADQQASDTIEQARQEARSEGERLVDSARSEIQREVRSAREELRQEISRLSLTAAERIIDREIDASTHEQLLADAMEEL